MCQPALVRGSWTLRQLTEIGGTTGGESINDGLGARLAVGVHGGLGQLDARVGAEGDDGDEVAGVEHLDDDF